MPSYVLIIGGTVAFAVVGIVDVDSPWITSIGALLLGLNISKMNRGYGVAFGILFLIASVILIKLEMVSALKKICSLYSLE